MGYKLWSTGELLTSPDVNAYLAKQSVITCTSAGRPTSPVEGMTIYETDTDRYAKYTGSAWEYFAGSRTSFTPTLTAATTNPSMGTGAIRNGWYTYLPGPSVQYTWFIQYGSTSVNIGSGNYFISLPVTAALPFGTSVHSSVGIIQVADSSPTTIRPGSCFVPGNNPTVIGMITSDGSIVSHSTPWTWGAGDYFSGSIVYPI